MPPPVSPFSARELSCKILCSAMWSCVSVEESMENDLLIGCTHALSAFPPTSTHSSPLLTNSSTFLPCSKRRTIATATGLEGAGAATRALQSGQLALDWSQASAQSMWKTWRQSGSSRILSSGWNSLRQTAHSPPPELNCR